MNSWSLLHDYMNETHDDAPWLDTTYDGFDEEQIKKVLKSQQQTQELLHELQSIHYNIFDYEHTVAVYGLVVIQTQ